MSCNSFLAGNSRLKQGSGLAIKISCSPDPKQKSIFIFLVGFVVINFKLYFLKMVLDVEDTAYLLHNAVSIWGRKGDTESQKQNKQAKNYCLSLAGISKLGVNFGSIIFLGLEIRKYLYLWLTGNSLQTFLHETEKNACMMCGSDDWGGGMDIKKKWAL